jgi:uncharacterized protein with NRDE domain
MCTILALVSVRADYPLIIATNRDEFFARPTRGPELLMRAPRAVGGRDALAGGTWMGVTDTGLFVGVTNQRTQAPPDPAKRSRGGVVMEALACGGAEAVRAYIAGLDGRAYNPFNLMWGGLDGLYTAYARSDTRELVVERVPPGIHVLPNDRLDSPDFFKVARAQSLLGDVASLPFEACVARLEQALQDRATAPLPAAEAPAEARGLPPALSAALSALAVVTPHYGTRSSTVTAFANGGLRHYRYADGPPGTPFVDVMPLFAG